MRESSFGQRLNRTFAACIFLILSASPAVSQRIAIVTPERTYTAVKTSEILKTQLAESAQILDRDLSFAAFSSFDFDDPFNLSREQSKNAAAAVGCDYLILVRGETLRRSSFELKDHFETFAAIYVVTARTGNLIDWRLISSKAVSSETSERDLIEKVLSESTNVRSNIQKHEVRIEMNIQNEGFPEYSASENTEVKPPLPYKRITPKYTSQAFLYDVQATVDVVADIDEKGRVVRTTIDRWAGFGLDEAVIDAVREMNWRPASLSGKQVPMRILLRYNFKKPTTGKN